MNCQIIGVTGLLASGKSTAVDILTGLATTHGIQVYRYGLSTEIGDLLRAIEQGVAVWASLSAEILTKLRNECRLGRLQSRENKIATANELRRLHGSDVLAQRIINNVSLEVDPSDIDRPLIIIDSIRNPGEVTKFRDTWGNRFRLLAVEAPVEVLVTRVLSRRRSDEGLKDLSDRDSVLAMIEQDSGVGQPDWGLQVSACIRMADWRIINAYPAEHLRDDLRRFWNEALADLWDLGETGSAHVGS